MRPEDLPLDPPAANRCLPAVYVDAKGNAVPNPRALLGLAPEGPLSADAVRLAYREQILAHPPEKDPRGAREVREAHQRLTNPERFYERVLGVLHVPRASDWGLSSQAGEDHLDAHP